jgi:predicted phage terminase large subunit-like protein
MAVTNKKKKIKKVLEPQPGPQTQFLSSTADITIYGGQVGGGKTYGVFLDTCRYLSNPSLSLLVLRRTKQDLRQEGGLWEESFKFYPKIFPKAKTNDNKLKWKFPSGASISFSAMQYEKDKYKFDGAQIPVIFFDEVQHFTEEQFFYMLSRNRLGQCKGFKPYIKATCNPKPKSWLKKFIRWWLDEEGRYPDMNKAGIIRYFIRDGNKIIWADTKEELLSQYPHSNPLSVTFIPSSIYDNPALLENDTDYLAKIDALAMYERLRLKGDWKIEPSAGLVFKAHWFNKVYVIPTNIIELIRYWDRAGTEKKKDIEKREKQGKSDPDATSGVLMARTSDDKYFILDRKTIHGTAAQVRKLIKATSETDRINFPKYRYCVGIEQDPGQAGKAEAEQYVSLLSGFNVVIYPAKQDKLTRASGLSSQAEHGFVYILEAPWNDEYLEQMESFPDGAHDDDVDASSGAFNHLCNSPPVGKLSEIRGAGDKDYENMDKYR